MTNVRPIIYCGEMVRAILEGRKTQTRRVINFSNSDIVPEYARSFVCKVAGVWEASDVNGYPMGFVRCPYGEADDHLWVRETWGAVSKTEDPAPIEECKVEYRADLPPGCTDQPGGWPTEDARGYSEAPHWKPSISMPRWASRITLEVMDVRVERLQDISEEDILREGVSPVLSIGLMSSKSYNTESFKTEWDIINAKRGYSWDSNPWVWVISFKPVEPRAAG